MGQIPKRTDFLFIEGQMEGLVIDLNNLKSQMTVDITSKEISKSTSNNIKENKEKIFKVVASTIYRIVKTSFSGKQENYDILHHLFHPETKNKIKKPKKQETIIKGQIKSKVGFLILSNMNVRLDGDLNVDNCYLHDSEISSDSDNFRVKFLYVEESTHRTIYNYDSIGAKIQPEQYKFVPSNAGSSFLINAMYGSNSVIIEKQHSPFDIDKFYIPYKWGNSLGVDASVDVIRLMFGDWELKEFKPLNFSISDWVYDLPPSLLDSSRTVKVEGSTGYDSITIKPKIYITVDKSIYDVNFDDAKERYEVKIQDRYKYYIKGDEDEKKSNTILIVIICVVVVVVIIIVIVIVVVVVKKKKISNGQSSEQVSNDANSKQKNVANPTQQQQQP